MELGDGRRPVEPVERLGHHGPVHRRVGEGDGLGPSGRQGHVRQHRTKHATHPLHWLDRHQPGPTENEHARQLAGARRQVEDASARPHAELVREPSDGGGGVFGPPSFVRLGGRAESFAGGPMDGRAHLASVGWARLGRHHGSLGPGPS